MWLCGVGGHLSGDDVVKVGGRCDGGGRLTGCGNTKALTSGNTCYIPQHLCQTCQPIGGGGINSTLTSGNTCCYPQHLCQTRPQKRSNLLSF